MYIQTSVICFKVRTFFHKFSAESLDVISKE